MDWSEAKAGTLAKFRTALGHVGTSSSVELLRELNEVHEICEKAQEEAARCGGESPCVYCLACQQLGGCGGVRAALSTAVVGQDWERAAEIIRGIISDLEGLHVPNESR